MNLVSIKNLSKTKIDLMVISIFALMSPGSFLLMFKRDIWDGTIIDYNLSLNNYEALQQWFFSSGWELQYYLLIFQDKIAEIINFPTRHVILGSSILTLIGLSIEIYLLAKNKFGIKREISLLSSLLFLCLPTWNVLSSSVMNIHLICLYLSLIGVRIFLDNGRLRQLFGIFLILMSYQLNSLLFFIPILVLVIERIKGNNTEINKFLSKRFFMVSLLSITYFIIIRSVNPNYGLYIGYNQISFPTSPGSIEVYLRNILNFSSYLVIPFISLFSIVFLKFLFNSSKVVLSKLIPKNVIWLLLLFFAAIFPYIAVGKTTNILELTDWSQRQSFVLAIPLVLLTGSLISLFSKVGEDSRSYLKRGAIFAITLLLPISLQVESFAIKLNRQHFESDLITQLRVDPRIPVPGTFQIYGTGIPKPDFRSYESNFLLYETYTRASWWSVISAEKDLEFGLPLWMKSKYADSYVYEYSKQSCENYAEIRASGYSIPVRSLLKRYLGIDNGDIRIVNLRTTCP